MVFMKIYLWHSGGAVPFWEAMESGGVGIIRYFDLLAVKRPQKEIQLIHVL
jgi:hypothetical protein